MITGDYIFTGTNVYEVDNATFTYPAVGMYTITVMATNRLGNTTMKYLVVAQNAVSNQFVLTSTAPVLYPTG